MRQSLFACILAMLSLLLPACDVHEFPEPPLPPVALNLKLRFNFGMGEMEDFKTIYVITRAAEDSTAFEARYQLRIHPSNGKGGFLMDSCLSYSFSHSQLQASTIASPWRSYRGNTASELGSISCLPTAWPIISTIPLISTPSPCVSRTWEEPTAAMPSEVRSMRRYSPPRSSPSRS